MKLNIHLVTWNGSKYIEFLFDSLKNQTYQNFKLIILDNASSDDTVEKIKFELNNFSVAHELVINKENKGFAGGHNQLFTTYNLEPRTYNLLLNQDMYLMPDCLERLIKFMDENPEVAVVSPRLMKWDFDRLQTSDFRLQNSLTDQIDTLGLKVLRNRRVIEKYGGKNWDEKKSRMELSHRTQNEAMEVFGVSGALPMFRKSVIDVVGLFDESFKNYKEDVDLAYRLRSAGYRAYTILDAVAYHDRSAAGPENLSDTIAITNKKNQSEWVKYNSYKNHLMVLIKNEYWQNYLLDLPWIKWYEFKKFVYFLLFEPKILKGWLEIWRMRKELKKKRYEIRDKRKIGWREMRRWWR